jgi:hypothetical protein
MNGGVGDLPQVQQGIIVITKGKKFTHCHMYNLDRMAKTFNKDRLCAEDSRLWKMVNFPRGVRITQYNQTLTS